MESLDLTNPTTLAAIGAIALLIVIGILIGFVRARKKHEPRLGPPQPPPEALAEERPKIKVEQEQAQAEPTQPIRIEDLVPPPPRAPVPPGPEARVTPPPAPPADGR